ncbi:MAG: site-specific DNA-methyltransferase [Elusimicrobiota bacterium]
MSNRLNKLTGREWLQNSFSIWRDIQKNSEERTLKHPAMFPIMLAERLIDIYTNSNEQIVLDPFMGSGTVLIGAQNKGLKGIGFEINKQYVTMAKSRLEKTYNSRFNKGNKKYEIINDSAENIEKYVKQNSVDLTITSPPYWDILNRTRTADRKTIRNYGNSSKDLGNIEDYNQFLSLLQNVFGKVYQVTKLGCYCVVVVMDIRKKSKLYLLHSDIIQKMNEINFSLCDIFIWDRQKEYNNMRPLGYPYAFIVNKVHEYIMIFKKC